MSLNLKNPRAHELASQLAEIMGESLTTVVIRALEEKLAKEKLKAEHRTQADKLLAFAERFSSGMAANVTSAGHAAMLFDENGLPG